MKNILIIIGSIASIIGIGYIFFRDSKKTIDSTMAKVREAKKAKAQLKDNEVESIIESND